MALLDAYSGAVSVATTYGELPLHFAVSSKAPLAAIQALIAACSGLQAAGSVQN